MDIVEAKIVEYGEVYAFRIDGETVVAEVIGRQGSYLILEEPQQLAFVPRPGTQTVDVGLLPFIQGISDNKKLYIKETAISGIAQISTDLRNLYTQATTGLQIAANNGSLA